MFCGSPDISMVERISSDAFAPRFVSRARFVAWHKHFAGEGLEQKLVDLVSVLVFWTENNAVLKVLAVGVT